jgi:hypothetical protein
MTFITSNSRSAEADVNPKATQIYCYRFHIFKGYTSVTQVVKCITFTKIVFNLLIFGRLIVIKS